MYSCKINIEDYYNVNNNSFLSSQCKEELTENLKREVFHFIDSMFYSFNMEKILRTLAHTLLKEGYYHRMHYLIKDRYLRYEMPRMFAENIKIRFSDKIKKAEIYGEKTDQKELIGILTEAEDYIAGNQKKQWLKEEIAKTKKSIIEDIPVKPFADGHIAEVTDPELREILEKFNKALKRSDFGNTVVFGEYCFETDTIILYIRAIAESNKANLKNAILAVLYHETFHAYHALLLYLFKKMKAFDYERTVVAETLAAYAEYKFCTDTLGSDPIAKQIKENWRYLEIDYWPYAGAEVIINTDTPDEYFMHLLISSVSDPQATFNEIFYLCKAITNKSQMVNLNITLNKNKP